MRLLGRHVRRNVLSIIATPQTRWFHKLFIAIIRSILGFWFQVPFHGTGRSRIRANQEVMLKRIFSKFWADESAATAIEYGLIAAGISLAIITVVNGLGTTLNTKFTTINNSLK
jgi:pilus assembly protein Flp/PilA